MSGGPITRASRLPLPAGEGWGEGDWHPDGAELVGGFPGAVGGERGGVIAVAGSAPARGLHRAGEHLDHLDRHRLRIDAEGVLEGERLWAQFLTNRVIGIERETGSHQGAGRPDAGNA